MADNIAPVQDNAQEEPLIMADNAAPVQENAEEQHLILADDVAVPQENAQEEHMITLVSSDGLQFSISRFALRQSITINTMLNELGERPGEAVPILNVNGKTLEKVIVYLNHHQHEEPITELDNSPKDVPYWDKMFLRVNSETLRDLYVASNFLDIKRLFDVCSQTIADMIRGETTEQMRRTYNIPNDLTEEEEAQIRLENAWCERAAR